MAICSLLFNLVVAFFPGLHDIPCGQEAQQKRRIIHSYNSKIVFIIGSVVPES